MNRRAFLDVTGVSVLAAGCISGDSPPKSTPTDCTSAAATESTPAQDGKVLRKVSVGDVDPNPSTGVEFSVDLPASEMTTTSTATVRIALTNATGEELQFGCGRPAPFSTGLSERQPGWSLLTESRAPNRSGVDCWQPAFDNDGEYAYVDVIDRHALAPCDSVSTTFELWAHDDNDCMPTGEFRFEDGSYELYGPDHETASPDISEFAWGFTLVVEEP